jgi:hypothetical protein
MTGDRPLAVEDRRRITKAAQRRALRWRATTRRCHTCGRMGAIRASGGHLGICLNCGTRYDLRPSFWLVRGRWHCEVNPAVLE